MFIKFSSDEKAKDFLLETFQAHGGDSMTLERNDKDEYVLTFHRRDEQTT